MCGLCGIVQPAGQTVDTSRLEGMRDSMRHRGPDDAGQLIDGNVGLGHRRLSIIDLSAAGQQPLANEDESLFLIFNGELYNYVELRADLRRAGHHFTSQTDCEVVLHAVEEWGIEASLVRFVGMFAFALYDRDARQLLLARDALGIKPLYYQTGEEVLFASELRAILRAGGDATPSRTAIYDFLSLERFDHNETTFFAGIQQLQPGHFIRMDVDEPKSIVQIPYWNPTPEGARATFDYARPVETFKDLFDDSVRLQLRSDVPLGIFLSGGLDSSAIVESATRQSTQTLQSFSVNFDDDGFDETAFASQIAETYGTHHHRLTPDATVLRDQLGDFVAAQETPTNGPGPFSEWCVAQLAATHVKVALSGQGPDEMLGGYHLYFLPYLHTRMRQLDEQGQRVGWRRLLGEARRIGSLTGRHWGIYLAAAIGAQGDGWRRRLKQRQAQSLMQDELLSEVTAVAPVQQDWPGDTALDKALSEALLGWGLRRLLHYTDRSTMAVSLEARVPFLDHRLVEFCIGLPYHTKIRDDRSKWILREAMKDRLPSSIVERRDKKGFPTPVGRWLRESEEFVRDHLAPATIARRGLLRESTVTRLQAEHFDGSTDHGWALWRLLNLELWYQTFVDKAAGSTKAA
ncbi:MAG: asparagine synthase (glutamine-hydrolyzing) [Gemmatimonadetes bacterium]|nr:asparagine synthase (glutamine-hydrolyzing) [Gemmatimonadota bacterium]MBT5060704.1 asparagine synthase (glutamine-hydrolyzing) [Gemmatimonadota bacterium]MBT5145387.1 asparagine synthase (glutamine-hydrolyzing) [Gemmatimonadota bacterium]MBT5591575.1 asparagine synthase (glutamine-hydrolyzing) [Gemmatimonadota bacterium]MBT5961970.1 asparagine synthase (glutamine-hydrolyzing) [Gemmatimonadota bacterium]